MKSIEQNIVNEIVINKSKFICHLFKINSEDEFNNYLETIKNDYKGATHFCYAYIVSNIKRFNDDKEPNGTAGLPILNVLESNSLNNIGAIVIRYFGGIKLGTGGLSRAYSNSIIEALDKTNIIELSLKTKIEITFDINNIKKIDYLLNKCTIYEKIFDENITYIFSTDKDIYLDIVSNIKNYIKSYKVLEDVYEKKA